MDHLNNLKMNNFIATLKNGNSESQNNRSGLSSMYPSGFVLPVCLIGCCRWMAVLLALTHLSFYSWLTLPHFLTSSTSYTNAFSYAFHLKFCTKCVRSSLNLSSSWGRKRHCQIYILFSDVLEVSLHQSQREQIWAWHRTSFFFFFIKLNSAFKILSWTIIWYCMWIPG